MSELHIHFETRPDKPDVFRMRAAPIAAALARSGLKGVRTSLGEDLKSLDWLGTADGLVASNDLLRDPKFPLADLARAAPKLRWIHMIGAGIEPLLPLDWLPPRVTLTNNSGVHVDKMRQSATMMLLMLNARMPQILANQRQARWDAIFTPTTAGKTVLVLGVGDIGASFAHAAKTLGMTVIGVRRGGGGHPDVDRMVAVDALETVLPLADMVVIATPLTPATRHIIDRRRLGLMKRGASLVNVGRGGCLDHAALIDALDGGTLAGAVIDVYDPEPLPASSPLWRAPNLVMIPHVSSDDLELYLPKTYDLAFANAARLMRGETLLNAVDPALGY
jgi:phosphoglycerate dehydrogenase-like enzyme